MPTFAYVAVSCDGNQSQGTLELPSREDLLHKLRAAGLTPISIKQSSVAAEQAASRAPQKSKKTVLALPGTVSRKELMVFTRQLATTLNAGLPLIRILHVVAHETQSRRVKEVLQSVGLAVQKGKSFSEALAEHPSCFDSMYINMVKVGEQSGDLPTCVNRLAEMLEKEHSLRRKVKSAMAYPSFILAFTTLMTYALVAFLMPLFVPVFRDSGLNIQRDYPLTDFLLKASDFATSVPRMSLLVLGLFAVFAGLRYALSKPAGRLAWDTLKVNFPFFKVFVRNVVAARFARSFSLLLKSGVPVVSALGLTSKAAGNVAVSVKLNKSARDIGEGGGITATLKTCRIFPDMLVQMSAMGEEAGSLPDMMERVADYYDEEVDASVDAMTALLEPSMMVLIGGVVCVFVMGVLLPILGVSSSVQSQM